MVAAADDRRYLDRLARFGRFRRARRRDACKERAEAWFEVLDFCLDFVAEWRFFIRCKALFSDLTTEGVAELSDISSAPPGDCLASSSPIDG